MKQGISTKYILLKLALLLLLLAPLSPSNPQSSSFIDVIPTFFLILVCSILYMKEISVRNDALSIVTLYIVVLLNSVITSLFSQSHDGGVVRVFITMAAFAIYYLLLTNVCRKIEIVPFVLNAYKRIALVASIVLIAGGILGVTYSWGRFSLDIIGIHKNPNYVTGFIMGAFALNSYEFFVLNQKDEKLIRITSLTCMPVAFALSGTRAAILGAIIIMFLVVLLKLSTGKNKLRNIGMLVLVFVVFLLLLDKAIEFIPERYLNRITFSEENYTEDIRVSMWISALRTFFSGNFITGFGMYGAERYNNNMFGLSTHNILLEALFDWGILGFGLFLATLFCGFRNVAKEDKREVLVFMLGLYWPVLFQNGLYALNFWFPLIMTRLMIEYQTKKRLGLGHKNNDQGRIGECK